MRIIVKPDAHEDVAELLERKDDIQNCIENGGYGVSSIEIEASSMDVSNAVYFGRAVAAARCERGLSRQDVVDTGALSYPYLAEIEKGQKVPSLHVVERLAGVFNVRADELLARSADLRKRFGPQ